MSTIMMQLVGLWLVVLLAAWVIYEIKEDWA